MNTEAKEAGRNLKTFELLAGHLPWNGPGLAACAWVDDIEYALAYQPLRFSCGLDYVVEHNGECPPRERWLRGLHRSRLHAA